MRILTGEIGIVPNLVPNVLLAIVVGTLFAVTSPIRAEDRVRFSHEEIFQPDQLLDVKFELPEGEWDKLRSQTRPLAMAFRKPPVETPFHFVKADVIINGQRIRDVGIRKKGFVGSLDQKFPSLKIKFDEFVEQRPIRGLTRLTLNNNKQDATVISQWMTYRFFRQVGLPAPRCTFARVTVNDNYLGIYSNVESIKKPFLQRVFGDNSGKLYEGALADLFVDRLSDIEAKNGIAKDRAELKELAELLAMDGDLDTEQLSAQLDVDAFLRFWATESLLNMWDGYTANQNNYFLYHNPADSKFYFIPWGADASFTHFEMVRGRNESVHDVATLPNRLYHTAGFEHRYREQLNKILTAYWDETKLLAEINRLEEFLKPHLHDRQKSFSDELGRVRKFVRTRRNEMDFEMEKPTVKIAEKPRQPAVAKSVGSVTGSFQVDFTKERPKNPMSVGKAQLTMELDGKPVEFSQLGVHLEKSRDAEGAGTRSIVFVGKRKSNRIRIKLALGLSEARFRSGSDGHPILVQGNLEEGGFGLLGIFSTQGMRLAYGTVTFSEFDADAEGPWNGEIDIDVVRLHGL